MLRILLVPAFILSLFYYSPENFHSLTVAAWVFAAACLTDALDGFIARILNQKSTLGSYIDPIADKLLLCSGFISLTFMHNLPASMKIPEWVTITVISREVIIIIGSTLIFLSTGALKAAPLFIGKVTTALQMATLCAVLLAAPQVFVEIFFVLTVFLTALSGVLYIRMGEKMFQTGNNVSS